MTISNRNIVSAIVVLLCAMALWTIPSQVEDGESGFASGAAMLPDIAVSLIMILALLELSISLTKTLRSPAGREKTAADDVTIGWPQIWGVVIVAGIMALYAMALSYLGYLASSALLLVILMKCTGGRNVAGLVGMTLIAVVVLYLGMRYGFGIRLQALPDLSFLKG